MRLLAHLLAADVRRHRVLLASWLLVVAGTAILDGVRPTLATEPALRGMAAFLGTLLWLAELLLKIVLVALVVQTHPLVGSDAFWMTRPIPPLTLLASKSVLLGIVMIVAPAFTEAALMASSGVPLALIGKIAIETALCRQRGNGGADRDDRVHRPGHRRKHGPARRAVSGQVPDARAKPCWAPASLSRTSSCSAGSCRFRLARVRPRASGRAAF